MKFERAARPGPAFVPAGEVHARLFNYRCDRMRLRCRLDYPERASQELELGSNLRTKLLHNEIKIVNDS